jgi:hypothetical protein
VALRDSLRGGSPNEDTKSDAEIARVLGEDENQCTAPIVDAVPLEQVPVAIRYKPSRVQRAPCKREVMRITLRQLACLAKWEMGGAAFEALLAGSEVSRGARLAK